MLAEPDRYRAPPEANVPLMEGLNTNVGFKTINISFLSSNVTWFSHIPWLLQTTERIQRGIFWYIYELFVLFHLWNTFVCQWHIFHFLVQIHNNHDSLLSPGHDPNVLLIWLFPVLFYLWIFNIRDSGSNLNIVEFNQSFLLIMICILMNLELTDGLNWLISELHGSIHPYPSCQYKGYRRTSTSFYVDAGGLSQVLILGHQAGTLQTELSLYPLGSLLFYMSIGSLSSNKYCLDYWTLWKRFWNILLWNESWM